MTDKVLTVAAGVLAVGLAGTAAFLEFSPEDGVDPGMVVVARQQATNFFSLDHRHAAEDVDKVLKLATGTFKKEYAAQRDQIIENVTSKKLVVTAVIPDDGAAVEFYDEDEARVLVSVDVTRTNEAAETDAEPAEDRYRTRVLLTKVGDRWLVSGLNQVG
jgi:Mce-associated membrane protein